MTQPREAQVLEWANRKRVWRPFGEGRADGAAMIYGIISLISIFGLFAVDSSPSEFAISLMILALGAMTGWATAIVVAPYDPSEEKRVAAVVGAISAVITGYILGKTNGVIEHILSPTVFDHLTPLHAFRVVGFLIEASGTLLCLYSIREYYDKLWLAATTTKVLVDQLPDDVKAELINSLHPQALSPQTKAELIKLLQPHTP